MARNRKHPPITAIAGSLAFVVLACVAVGPIGGIVAACIAIAVHCGHSLSKRRGQEEQDAPERKLVDLPQDNQEEDDEVAAIADDEVADTSEETSDDHDAEGCVSEAMAAHDPPDTEAPSSPPDTPSAPFDFNGFFDRILSSDDLYDTIGQVANETRARLDASDRDDPSSACGIDRFLLEQIEAERLLDAEDGDELESPAATLLWRNGSCYLRMSPRITYGAYLRNMRLEALLNTLLLFKQSEVDLSFAPLEELYRLRDRFARSVCAQAPFVDAANWTYLAMPWQTPAGPANNGEWSIRYAIADGVETTRLPYRLECHYRVNASGGDVAIEVAVTPASVFPRTAYVSGLGILPTTDHMRRRAASDYSVRVGLLVASHAFHASSRISRVWIAGVLETPTKRSCLYSACLDRRSFANLNMQRVLNPLATLQSLGGEFEVENEVLVPTNQCFMLEDERFCPPVRHDMWQLSERSLPASAAWSLGASRVSGLNIHEELPRMLAAEEMMRNLGNLEDTDTRNATQQCVAAALEAAGTTSDLDVWRAASRVVKELIDGTLDPCDHQALYQRFLAGSSTSAALERAQALLANQDPKQAERTMHKTLAPSMADGRYDDTTTIAYRSFDNFVDRVLYNRMNAQDKRCVVLLPDELVAAHLFSAALLLAQGDRHEQAERALPHLNWTLLHAPFNASAHQLAAECLERLGRLEEACDVMRHYLDVAYNAQGIGVTYHSLARLFYRQGKTRAAQACYQLCVSAFPELMPFVLIECQALATGGISFEDAMDASAIEEVLSEEDVPLAPTSAVAIMLFDGAAASVDAEVFPVAQDLMHAIALLTRDDVIFDIYQSLEREPDA